MTYHEHKISSRYHIEIEDGQYTLYEYGDNLIQEWDDIDEMLMDIDYSEVGEIITLEEWQGLWDWAQGIKIPAVVP